MIILDTANGAGSQGIKPFLVESYVNKYLDVKVINDNDFANMNNNCGSEHVQKERKKPLNLDSFLLESDHTAIGAASFLSLDGDADRIVY